LNNTISAQINPLQIPKIDLMEIFPTNQNTIDFSDFLKFLCEPGYSYEIQDLIERYKDINQENPKLFAFPVAEKLMERFIWPLKNAKASFVFGNFMATIALSGIVAEMISTLIYKINKIKINGKTITPTTEKLLFGKEAEELTHFRRLEILKAFNFIDSDLFSKFDLVRKSRNRYFHSFSLEMKDLRNDAKTTYLTTVYILTKVIGLEIKDGKLILDERFLKFIEND